MNCLRNSRSALSRLLPRGEPTTVSAPRPLPAQAPPARYYHYASRLPRGNAASRPPPQVPSHRYFFTSPWGKKGATRSLGGSRWYHDSRKVTSAVLIAGGGAVSIYLGNLEAVPYTNRARFTVLSRNRERQVGEAVFALVKKWLGPTVLPPHHPVSLRVRRIASGVVRAAHTGSQRREAGAVILGRFARKDAGAGAAAQRDDESRNGAEGLGAQPQTSGLLDGWEVIVVRSNLVSAMCMPGGKILVTTGLLHICRTDAEIAAVLGHEVGHAIARHSAEGYTRGMWLFILNAIICQFTHSPIMFTTMMISLSMFFSRRMEIEADHIGLLLMAAAGYDPRVRPSVLEKLGNIFGDSAPSIFFSSHPSCQERAQLLSQDHVMNGALELYREAPRSGLQVHGTDVFAFAVVLFLVFCYLKG